MHTPDTWTIFERAFDPARNRHYEALMALGSGVLQQRAAPEEGLASAPQDADYARLRARAAAGKLPPLSSHVGTYLPGITGPHPSRGDELINLPSLHGLELYCAGQRLDLELCRISEYVRRLDLRTGRLTRTFVWHTLGGATLHVVFERFISAARRHVQVQRCTVTHRAGPPAELRVVGALSAEVRTNGHDHFTSVDLTGEHGPITLSVQTDGGTDVAAAALLTCDHGVPWRIESHERWVATCGGVILDPGQSVRIEKFAALTSSHHVRGSPLDAARKLAWDAASTGYDVLAAESDTIWAQRWDATDVEIDGDPASQLGLRVALYHLLRAVMEDDPRCAIDPQGAAGEADCGRYFWDTEIFMLPAFLYTRPAVGRTLARFRYLSLAGARRNAARAGYPGARYAWESTPHGDEYRARSPHADHAVHVTADVAYGLFHAWVVQPDDDALLRELAEVLLETSRFWVARVYFNAERGQYELLGVMGPDQFVPFSRNNAYTNRLAAFGLLMTVFVWETLAGSDAAGVSELRLRLKVDDGELPHFAEVAAKLRLPYDAERQLVLQADDFFAQEPFDAGRWWPDRTQPAGGSVSRERLYRSQILQQADALLLMALFPHEFDTQQMRVAWDTYAPRTSHDAPVSPPIHTLIAAWLNLPELAFDLWRRATTVEPREWLEMSTGTAAEGVHLGAAGAVWQAAIFGFCGVRSRMQSEILWLDPHLPAAWQRVNFPFVWAGQPLRITLSRAAIEIVHRGTQPLEACLAGHRLTLPPGQTTTIQTPPPPS